MIENYYFTIKELSNIIRLVSRKINWWEKNGMRSLSLKTILYSILFYNGTRIYGGKITRSSTKRSNVVGYFPRYERLRVFCNSVRPKVRPSLFLIECTLRTYRTNRYFFESRHSYFIKSPYCLPRDNKGRKLGPYHIFVFVDKQQTAAWFCRSDDRSKNLFPIANSLRKDSPIGAVVFDFFFPSNFFRF